MILGSFVAGLTGVSGTQVRYQNPQTLDQALKIALAVQKAERQEKFGESFYASFDNSVRLRSLTPTHRASYRSRGSVDARHAANHTQGQRKKSTRSNRRLRTSESGNAQAKAALTCYEGEGVGHFARDYPTRFRKKANSTNSPGKRNPSERSKLSHARVEKPAPATKKGVSKNSTNLGNAREV